VKGGHVTVNQIRDLRGTKERERAALALFISIEALTRPMRDEALAAGFSQPPNGGCKVRAVQMLTVAELLTGQRFQVPFSRSNTGYARSGAIAADGGQMSILD
jgi:site-specific DNA-methyltransferase (adenine-specific)